MSMILPTLVEVFAIENLSPKFLLVIFDLVIGVHVTVYCVNECP